MSYKPRVWKSKEAITAPKLNNLEEAVANLYKKNVGDKIPYLDSDNLSDMELTAITDSSGNLKGLSGTYKTNDNNIRKISFKITQE
mgnify:FL=1